MKTKLVIALGLGLAAVGTTTIATRAAASPPNEKIAYYYFDAAHTQYAGWQQLASCTPPYGVQPVHGTKTSYFVVETSPC